MSDHEEIVRLTNSFFRAVEQQDADTLHHLIADDCVFTGSGGSVWGTHGKFGSKASAIARWSKPPPPEITEGGSSLSEERVTVSGDTAVLVGLITDRWVDDQGEHLIRSWVTDVWVRQEGKWRFFASHESTFFEQ